MAQPKANPAYFERVASVHHISGYTFTQRGGMVDVVRNGAEVDGIVWAESGRANPGRTLTKLALVKIAVAWLSDNDPEVLR